MPSTDAGLMPCSCVCVRVCARACLCVRVRARKGGVSAGDCHVEVDFLLSRIASVRRLCFQCSKQKGTNNSAQGKNDKAKRTQASKPERPNQDLGPVHECCARVSVRVIKTKNARGKSQKNSFDVVLDRFEPWHSAHPKKPVHAASETSPEERTLFKEYMGSLVTTAKKQLLMQRFNASPSSSTQRSMQTMNNIIRVVEGQQAKEHTFTATTTTAALLAPLVADPDRAFVAVLRFADGQLSTLTKRAGSSSTSFTPGEPFQKRTAGQ